MKNKIFFLFAFLLIGIGTNTLHAQDSDGDGIANILDLDDDNDGILDTNEKGACGPGSIISLQGYKGTVYNSTAILDAWTQIDGSLTFPTAGFSQIATFDYIEFANSSKAFDVDFNASADISPTNVDMANYQGTALNSPTREFAVMFSKTINADEVGTYRYSLNGGDNHVFVYKNGTKVAAKKDVYGTVLPDTNFVTISVVVGDKIDVLLVEEDSGNTYVNMTVTKTVGQCMLDTDGDGIPNHLDLDSDGDGCPDAIEGSENVAIDQVWPLNLPSTDANYAYRGQIKVIYNGVTTNSQPNIVSQSAAANGVPQLVNNAGNNLNSVTNPSNLAGIADNTDVPGPTTADIGQGVGTSANSSIKAAQCATAFGCTPALYLSQTASLYNVNTSTNPFTYPLLGTASANYNSTAINPLDGIMYSIVVTNSNVAQAINPDGSSVNLGAITGLPTAVTFNAGEIDNLGNYYVKVNTNNNQLYKINLNTLTATLITLSASINVPDIAFNITNGLLYGINSTNGQLVSINPATSVVTPIGITPGAASFGAMFASSTGEMYGVDNLGGFYQFNLTNGQRVLISNAPASSANDGAHCVTAPIVFSADLAITKTDGKGTYTPGTTNTYTVVVSNNGPFGVLGATVSDPLPAGIPSGNVSYSVPVVTGGATTSITSAQNGALNDVVNLPVGGTITYTINISIPSSFTGNLVNVATVTSPANSTDSTPANNTATDTDSSACAISATNPDSDGDGISDYCDLDDDNDGILDTFEECIGFRAQNSTGTWNGDTVSNLTTVFTGTSPQTNVQSLSDSQVNYYINQNGGQQRVSKSDNVNFSFSFSTPVKASEIAFYIEDLDPSIAAGSPTAQYTFLINGAPSSSFASMNIGGASPYLVYNASTGSISLSNSSNDHRILLKGIGNQLVSSITMTSTGIGSGDAVAYSLFAKKSCDTDNDGIPNYLDLDSDGDGCTDAIEGGATFTTANLLTATGTISTQTPNQNLGNTVGSTPTTIGVPTIAGTGQSVGQSQNSTVSECLDSDNDGVPNICDLDDDNDGILDIQENTCALTGQTIRIGYIPNVRDLDTDNGYTFDGAYMNTSGVLKLLNSANFGPSGTVKANIVLVPMTTNPITKADITSLNLNAIFLGGVDNAVLNSYLNSSEFAAIKDWSDDSPKNFVVSTQGQTVAWDATISAGNINPDVPTSLGSTTSIFNGPFGSVSSFNQGGGYQAYFIPGTQCFTQILAQDNSGRPVIYFDGIYNDLMIADVDILTSLGGVTAGNTVTSNNDRLFMNIWAFVAQQSGCEDNDTDADGIPNHLDLDSDNDGCVDAFEGDENVTYAQLATASGAVTVGIGSTASNQNLGNTVDANGVPTLVNSGGAADIGGDQGQGIGSSTDATVNNCFCYKPAVLDAGNTFPTKHGITALRAGADNENWPMTRQSAWTVLESKEKGFVVNRVATTSGLANITNPVEGMMVYDEQEDCLKIYTLKSGDTVMAWHCLTTPACPD